MKNKHKHPIHPLTHEQALKLSETDTRLLIEALDRPAKPNSKLQQAASRYKDKNQ